MTKLPSRTRKQVSATVIRLSVPVLAASFRRHFKAELDAQAKTVKIPGFRVGKVPSSQALPVLGRERIEAGALDRALRDAYVSAITEEKIVPVTAPELSLESFTAPSEGDDENREVARFTVDIEVVPEFELKHYERIRIKPTSPKEIREADVDEFLLSLRKQRASLKPAAEDVVAAKGMWADIGFSGTLDGVAREELTSDHMPLTIGEGQLIPGFEDEIIGMKPAEEKSFTITFPKDYRAEQFAGKKVTFSITLHELKEVILPLLDDAFAKTYGVESAAALETQVREALEAERKREAEEANREAAYTELAKLVKIELPKSLLEQEEKRLRDETAKRFGGAIPEELEKQIAEQAPKNVKLGLAIGKVVVAEGLSGEERGAETAAERVFEYAMGVRTK